MCIRDSLTSSTKERLEQLEETKRELEARIAEEKLAKPKVTEEFIRFWLLRFRKLDMSLKDQRQALVDTFINAIYLDVYKRQLIRSMILCHITDSNTCDLNRNDRQQP